jgi:hypothetical protein
VNEPIPLEEFDLMTLRRLVARCLEQPEIIKQSMVERWVQMGAILGGPKQSVDNPERHLHRLLGVIDSMASTERCHPMLIGESQIRRIAAGAGIVAAEVKALIKEIVDFIDFMSGRRALLSPTLPPRRPTSPWRVPGDKWSGAFPTWDRNLLLWEFTATTDFLFHR